MSSVSSELAALRERGTVRKNAATLSAQSPRKLTLSTPEAEAAALKAKREQDRLRKASAVEALRKNAGVSQEVEHSLKQKKKKREDLEKKLEARRILTGGATGNSNSGRSGLTVVVPASMDDGEVLDSPVETLVTMENSDEVIALSSDETLDILQIEHDNDNDSGNETPILSLNIPHVEQFHDNEINIETLDIPQDESLDILQIEQKNDSGKETNILTCTTPHVEQGNTNQNEEEENLGVPDLEDALKTAAFQSQAAQKNDCSSDNDDDNEDVNEDVNDENQPLKHQPPTTNQNRNEKKVRKMMSRLNMRPMSGILQVTLKLPSGNFTINCPDVYAHYTASSSGIGGKRNDTFVIFGEVKQQDKRSKETAVTRAMEASSSQVLARQKAAVIAEAGKSIGSPQTFMTDASERRKSDHWEEEDQLIKESSKFESSDIELVMTQASCSKAKAVRALMENDGDLVNAIMSLTN